MRPTPPTEFVSAQAIMEMLHIKSRVTLYRYENEGLPFHQIRKGGPKLYDPAEVRAWVVGSRWSARAAGSKAS